MSDNITVKYSDIIPFGLRIGVHHIIIIEVNTMGFIGEILVKISRPKVRRLQTCIPRVKDKFTVL